MTKADIVAQVAEGTGLSKIDTEAVIHGFFKVVEVALANGNGIEIRGFGTFKVKKKNSRNARNPKSGEKVYVPEHFVPVFKFSKDFKSKVDKGAVEVEE